MFVHDDVGEHRLHMERVEVELAELTGIINAAHGRVVELVAESIDADLWTGYGIHSPGHWLAWKTAIAPGRAKALVRLAERAGDLPITCAALSGGEISADQAALVARHVPAHYEASVMELVPQATVSQLSRTLPRYSFDPAADRAAGDAPEGDSKTSASKPDPVEERRDFAMGTDERGWWLNGHLPADEGAVVEAAIRNAREDLYRQATAALADEDPKPRISLTDGLVAMAESFLRDGQAAHPGSDRYLVHAHLQAGPDGQPSMTTHLGPTLPDHLRRLLTCDGTLRPVVERGGTPTDVGRDQRIVPRRVRRLIEHRDQGCAVPGCHQRSGLEIHHIIHWEDGGPTDTYNLLTLCRHHHRTHHLGQLHITGNADHPNDPTHPDPLTISDRWGRPMQPGASPTPVGQPPAGAARQAGLQPAAFRHPSGERMDPSAVFFNQTRPEPPAPPDSDQSAAAPSPPPPVGRAQDQPPPNATVGCSSSDPTRAGPLVA